MILPDIEQQLAAMRVGESLTVNSSQRDLARKITSRLSQLYNWQWRAKFNDSHQAIVVTRVA